MRQGLRIMRAGPFRDRRRGTALSDVVALVAIVVSVFLCVASAGPVRLELGGGLMHTSGFFAHARLGGQHFHLQVDTSQGMTTVPGHDCETCRIGDRRYDVTKSSKGGRAVSCGDKLCQPHDVCRSGMGGKCPVCGTRGRCCVPKKNPGLSLGLPGIHNKDAYCAYNLAYSPTMGGNGTMHVDALKLGDVEVPGVVFSVMREESRTFEMAYVDGMLGLGFNKANCHPTCAPAALDFFANATGLPKLFTMCVGRFGGALTLGAADESLATEPFKYVKLLDALKTNHYVVAVKGYGKVGEHSVMLPELALGVWSSATTSIAVGKTTFLAILEMIMEKHCDVPGLCSMHSWFRPQSCRALTDEDMAKMPNLTFYLEGDLPIVLEPSDYLLEYKKVDGKLYRCVAFIVTDLLKTKGVGIMLGANIMRRYAVVYDQKGDRIGIAKAKHSKCGPATGTTAGLAESNLGVFKNLSDADILTANSPRANLSAAAGSTMGEDLQIAEMCRSIDGCGSCSSNDKCAYAYGDGKCISVTKAGGRPYPFCTGFSCVCSVVGSTGWLVGIILGVLLACSCAGCCGCVYWKRKRKLRYESVVPFDAAENELESF